MPDFLLVDLMELFSDLGSGVGVEKKKISSENDQFDWSFSELFFFTFYFVKKISRTNS